ncbi:LacI family DNA-binding transcriptional regulator [Cellulosilyticum sp. I15G10I2]|uniref:LacI family DNA-binding transcriptional regulator n=1 Tax=Cellulosilyticum sp. I15G10I2 TaxID=1892843 RepID=UPI00085BF545|nr:LacI family DNA-binding transcriptional regulator [Cellulosilyticum sp. I15G10I2]
MSYTIYDLARDSGVSVATVSRVINKNGSVKEKTRNKILKLMQENNYTPNAYARGLNNISMKTIGVLISDIGNPFFAELVKSIDLVCQKNQYKIILCSTENNAEIERKEIEMLIQKQVEGFIVAGSRPIKDENADFLIQVSQTYPIVMINSFIKGGNKLFSIMVDEKKASFEAYSQLLSRGHENIFFFGDLNWKTTVAKLSGLKESMEQFNRSFDKLHFIDCPFSYSSGKDGIKLLIERKIPFPYTICCSSDMIAIGAMRELLTLGIKIPEQVSLVGYSNTEISSLTTPSLTTIDQKMSKLGEKGANLFIEVLNGTYPINKKIYSEYEFLIRESTF